MGKVWFILWKIERKAKPRPRRLRGTQPRAGVETHVMWLRLGSYSAKEMRKSWAAVAPSSRNCLCVGVIAMPVSPSLWVKSSQTPRKSTLCHLPSGAFPLKNSPAAVVCPLPWAMESYSESSDTPNFWDVELKGDWGQASSFWQEQTNGMQVLSSCTARFPLPQALCWGITGESLPPLLSRGLESPEVKVQPQPCIKLQVQLQPLLQNGKMGAPWKSKQ